MKYGLYGAVLAGLVGGTVAWGSVDKTVNLVVDGQAKQVHTTASRVSDVLDDAGYHVGVHDLVAPAPRVEVHDGSKVVYKRGRLLHLDVNGVRRDVWTTAPTVSDALLQLGYSTADFTSVSRAKRLALGATDITVRTPRLVTIVHDGMTQQVTTTEPTVARLLSDLGIAFSAKDRLSAAPDSILKPNQKIVVGRVKHTILTTTAALPFPVKNDPDATLDKGQTQVVTPGQDGTARITYSVVYVDGKVVGKTPVRTVVLSAPTTQVVKIGTKPPAPVVVAPVVVVPANEAQAIAKKLAQARGWGDDQFACLVPMWSRESGWRVNASNPSGAYGIPQALPGSKMASAGPNWQTDAATQITWGLGYIAGRYVDPCGAWAFWQAHNWY
ncbi:MAG: ubiquitin-like domain-containing protein [Actinomycetota bacterium]|nr:ubiquitin-like domain-containing protein [Actinomycetota bacterium]